MTMFARGSVKLGALPSKIGDACRSLKLAHYLELSQLTEFVPPEFDWFIDVPDSADLNDRLGICTVAAQGKMVRSWTQNATGKAATITDSDLLKVYRDGAGYDPSDPSTDQGWYMIDALKYWQKTGIAGHKIGAYAAVNPVHRMMLRAATYLFGGTYIAFDLPNSIWGQEVWDVVANDGGPAGGHCVTLQAFDNDQAIVETWGAPQRVTWKFLERYCSEAYAIISPDILRGNKTVTGLDTAMLQTDLALVRA